MRYNHPKCVTLVLKTTFKIDYFGITDIGLMREHNEDVWRGVPEDGCFLLADGMGGHLSGEVAAQEAVEQFARLFKESAPPQENSEEIITFFKELLKSVNGAIYEKGQSNPALTGMGTTLCALNILSSSAIVSHVGDSRIYRLRNGQLQRLTEDHSLVSELLALGVIKNEDTENFPYKHILTRALGTHPTVEPSVKKIDVVQRDLFMLCSDGLTNFVRDDEIKTHLISKNSLQHRAEALVTLANAHGGADNITLVLVELN